eukprot:3305497-Rhodomonas_salina.1
MATNHADQATGGTDDRTEPLLPATSRRDAASSDLDRFVANCSAWLWKQAYYVVFLTLFWTACAVGAYLEAVDDFTWQSWFTIGLVCGALVLMANNCPPELVMLGITLILRLFDIITDEEAWYGFRSEGILAIGVLFVCSAKSSLAVMLLLTLTRVHRAVVAKSLEEAGTIESVVGIFLTQTNDVAFATFKVLTSCNTSDQPRFAFCFFASAFCSC